MTETAPSPEQAAPAPAAQPAAPAPQPELPHPAQVASLPQPALPLGSLPPAADPEKPIRVHYYVKIAVSTFLCALLLLIGVPVFMESRVTGSLAYTALGVVMVAFGLILALAVLVLLFKPPFKTRISK